MAFADPVSMFSSTYPELLLELQVLYTLYFGLWLIFSDVAPVSTREPALKSVAALTFGIRDWLCRDADCSKRVSDIQDDDTIVRFDNPRQSPPSEDDGPQEWTFAVGRSGRGKNTPIIPDPSALGWSASSAFFSAQPYYGSLPPGITVR